MRGWDKGCSVRIREVQLGLSPLQRHRHHLGKDSGATSHAAGLPEGVLEVVVDAEIC